MRYARYASVHPSMSVGYGPWNVADPQVLDVVRDSAVLHDRLHPYIYSAAVDTHRTGFPYTMTPLTLAFPDDPAVYELENTARRGYQWLIGDALMAIPLYGNDYATAGTRDVYLPRGRWIDYDTGEVYDGPATLKQHPIPVTRTPLLVGGSGLVVERRGGRLVARLYHVTTRSETTFHHQDGRASRVRLEVTSWREPVVVTSASGAPVPSSNDGPALTFAIEPGVDYIVRSRAR
jgi:alpha-glucosidase (family GH31 glycosyl hydrolase)